MPEAAPTYSVGFQDWSLVIVVTGLTAVLGFIYLVLCIWDRIKPHPPYHKQFAPLDHLHDDRYVVRIDCHAAIARYEKTSAHLEGELAALHASIIQGFKDVDKADEERAVIIHNHLNPISDKLHSLIGSFEEHTKHEGRTPR